MSTPLPNFVTIRNGEYLTDDTLPLLRACVERSQTHHNVDHVTISLNERDAEGWLEFAMVFKYRDGGGLYVGCIQRKPGEPFEFHT